MTRMTAPGERISISQEILTSKTKAGLGPSSSWSGKFSAGSTGSRLDRKSLRKSPVTLFELIIELKNLEKEERRRRRLPPAQEDFLVEADDVVGIAHEEGYQDSSRQVIEECLANADPDTEITLAELCSDLGWCLPDVYIPLLFLALDGRCSIRQEEFFGDVYVHVVKVDEEQNPGNTVV
jgi:segregation and condensation protein A